MKKRTKLLALCLTLAMALTVLVGASFSSSAATSDTLRVGGSVTVNIPAAGGYVDLEFTPTETGYYYFYSSNYVTDPLAYLMQGDTYIVASNDNGTDKNFSIVYNLTAGTTYTLRCTTGQLSKGASTADRYTVYAEKVSGLTSGDEEVSEYWTYGVYTFPTKLYYSKTSDLGTTVEVTVRPCNYLTIGTYPKMYRYMEESEFSAFIGNATPSISVALRDGNAGYYHNVTTITTDGLSFSFELKEDCFYEVSGYNFSIEARNTQVNSSSVYWLTGIASVYNTDNITIYTSSTDNETISASTGETVTLEAELKDADGNDVDLSDGFTFEWYDSITGELIGEGSSLSDTVGDWKNNNYVCLIYDQNGDYVGCTEYDVYNDAYTQYEVGQTDNTVDLTGVATTDDGTSIDLTTGSYTYEWIDNSTGEVVSTDKDYSPVVGDWQDNWYDFNVYDENGNLVSTTKYYVFNETYVDPKNKVEGETGDEVTLVANGVTPTGETVDTSNTNYTYEWVDTDTGEVVSTDKNYTFEIGDWQDKTFALKIYDENGNLIATTYYYVYNSSYTGNTEETNVVGATISQGYFTYKITKVGTSTTKGELTVTGVTTKGAKATKLKVANTIKWGDYTYKVTAIAKGALKNHKKLKQIKIGTNVKTIGKKAFYNCKKLTKVTGGKRLVTIKASAFSGCKKLKTVKFTSNNLKTIGKKAFYNCKKLKTITLNSKKLKSVKKNAFKGCKKTLTIKVRKTKLAAYKKLIMKSKTGYVSTMKVTKK